VLVSNLGEQEVRGNLLLELPRLGLSGPLLARDALSQVSIPLKGPAMELSIARWQYRVLRIQAQTPHQESSAR
jgi:hypothetical protein